MIGRTPYSKGPTYRRVDRDRWDEGYATWQKSKPQPKQETKTDDEREHEDAG